MAAAAVVVVDGGGGGGLAPVCGDVGADAWADGTAWVRGAAAASPWSRALHPKKIHTKDKRRMSTLNLIDKKILQF